MRQRITKKLLPMFFIESSLKVANIYIKLMRIYKDINSLLRKKTKNSLIPLTSNVQSEPNLYNKNLSLDVIK